MRRRVALRKRYGRARARAAGKFAPERGKVQALLFPRSEWTIQDALTWSALQGFSTKHFDVTEAHIRVHPKGKRPKAAHVRTIPFGIQGTRAVVEWR